MTEDDLGIEPNADPDAAPAAAKADGSDRADGAGPTYRLVAIPGDGDMLMGLGSLATIGVRQPKNLIVVVLDNARYGETGMQPSHADAGVDFAATALACRFRKALTVTRIEEADAVRILLHSGEGPILVNAKIKPEDVPRVLPLRDGHAIKDRFIAALNARRTPAQHL